MPIKTFFYGLWLSGTELCNKTTKDFKNLFGKKSGGIISEYLNWALEKHGTHLPIPDDGSMSMSRNSSRGENPSDEEEYEDEDDEEAVKEFEAILLQYSGRKYSNSIISSICNI